MSQARVFVPQEALESWLIAGRASLEDDLLLFEGLRFRSEPAVHFLEEVSGSDDAHALVGLVKSQKQLVSLSAEHSPGAVVLGDNAYRVVDGYALLPEGENDKDLHAELVKLFAAP